MKQTSLRSALITSALLLFGACKSPSPATTTNAAAMNTKCPMSGEELGANSPTTTFDGKTIGFCCEKCETKFNSLSMADKKAKVAGAMPMK